MRVSQNMMYNFTLRSIQKNQSRMLELFEQAATNKRINDASDDPLGMAKVLSYRETLAKLDQYPRNINKAQSWLSATDSVLQDLVSNLRGAKDLALQQANDSASAESRLTAVQQVEGLYNSLIQMGNTRVGNQYIFGGSLTNIEPFGADGVYHGNNGTLSAEIGAGNYQVYNVPGSSFLTVDLNPNLGAPLDSSGLLEIPSSGYATGPLAQLDLNIAAAPLANTTYDLKFDLGGDGEFSIQTTTGAAPTQDDLGAALAAEINAHTELNDFVEASYSGGVLTLNSKSLDERVNDYTVSGAIKPYTNPVTDTRFSGATGGVESGFVLSAGVNNVAMVNIGGVGPLSVDLIADGGATAGVSYTGEEIAGFLEKGLESRSAAIGKELSFSVTYDSEVNRFTVANDASNVDSKGIAIGADNDTLTVDETPSGGGPLAITLAHDFYDNPEELATEIQQKLNDASAAVNYTVTWDQTAEQFSIAGDSGFDIPWSTQREMALTLGFDTDDAGGASYTGDFNLTGDAAIELLWDDPASTSAGTLGFETTASSGVLNAGQSDTSSIQVEFNIVAGVNDTFDITVDGAATATITVTPGAYSGEQLAQELQRLINADPAIAPLDDVIVNYNESNGGRFSIVSGAAGANSSIRLTPGGASDFLSTIGLATPSYSDGTDSVLLEDLNHGAGVRLDEGLEITDAAGNHVSLYTGSARTVADILNIINGNPVIGAGNNTLVVDETASGGGIINVTIPDGTYTPATLATTLDGLLDAASGAGVNYTVTWDPAAGRYDFSASGAVDVGWASDPGNAGIAQTLGFAADTSGAGPFTGDASFLSGVRASLNSNGSGLMLVDTNAPADRISSLRVFSTDTASDLGLYSEDTLMTITQSNNTVYFTDGGTRYKATLPSGTYNGNQMAETLKTSLEAAIDGAGSLTSLTFDVSYDPVEKKVSVDNVSSAVQFEWVSGGPDGRGSSSASVLGFTSDPAAPGTGPFVADQTSGTEGRGAKIEGSDLNALVRGYTPINQLYAGAEISLGKIKITNGDKEAVVDLSDAHTIQDAIELINDSGIGVTARISDSGNSLRISSLEPGLSPVVTDEDSTDTASVLGLQAGHDILGTLQDFKQALLDNDQEALERIVGNLQAAIDQTLEVLGDTGSRLINVEDMDEFTENYSYEVKELLSSVEDVDATQAITKFLNQQQAFDMALAAAAKTMEMSLLDFLS